MAVIPEITCRRCGSKYSGLRNRCPKCGAPRINQPTRVPPTTAAATPQTAANARSAVNIRWQFIFAGVLLLALILAVVVLVNGGSGKSSGSTSGGAGSAAAPAYIAADLPTPSPSPEPTPDASPTPVIESMAITFLNRTIDNHSMTLTNAGEIFDIDLDEMAEAYALHAEKMRRDDPTENLDAFSGGGAEAAPPVVDEGDGNYDHLVHLGGVDSTETETE